MYRTPVSSSPTPPTMRTKPAAATSPAAPMESTRSSVRPAVFAWQGYRQVAHDVSYRPIVTRNRGTWPGPTTPTLGSTSSCSAPRCGPRLPSGARPASVVSPRRASEQGSGGVASGYSRRRSPQARRGPDTQAGPTPARLRRIGRAGDCVIPRQRRRSVWQGLPGRRPQPTAQPQSRRAQARFPPWREHQCSSLVRAIARSSWRGCCPVPPLYIRSGSIQ